MGSDVVFSVGEFLSYYTFLLLPFPDFFFGICRYNTTHCLYDSLSVRVCSNREMMRQ